MCLGWYVGSAGQFDHSDKQQWARGAALSCSSCPHTSPPDLRLWDTRPPQYRHRHFSWDCIICPLHSYEYNCHILLSFQCFSISYLQANIPLVVPVPCLSSSCSSPISPSTIQLLFCHRGFFPATSTYALAK